MSRADNKEREVTAMSEICIDSYRQELECLVNIDSGTTHIAGVAKVAELMEGKYSAMGWYVERVDLGSAVGPGVMATNAPGAEQFDVLLVGHLDTVFPQGTAAARPFTVDGNVACGPGVADMKSGLLSMAYALKHLDQATLDRLAIGVVLNPDEEMRSVHSHAWIGDYAKRSKCVLVFEGARADGSLVNARKGVGIYEVEVKGGAAHAGNDHQKGRSAIIELLEMNDELREMIDKRAPIGHLRQVAARNGTVFLRQAALEKVFEGITSLAEIDRVTFVEGEITS